MDSDPTLEQVYIRIRSTVYTFQRMTEVDPFTRTKLAGLQEKVKLFSNRLIINSDNNGIRFEIFFVIFMFALSLVRMKIKYFQYVQDITFLLSVLLVLLIFYSPYVHIAAIILIL